MHICLFVVVVVVFGYFFIRSSIAKKIEYQKRQNSAHSSGGIRHVDG